MLHSHPERSDVWLPRKRHLQDSSIICMILLIALLRETQEVDFTKVSYICNPCGLSRSQNHTQNKKLQN